MSRAVMLMKAFFRLQKTRSDCISPCGAWNNTKEENEVV